jgi:pimeloyl-ACP methyl ester carboxylesterase
MISIVQTRGRRLRVHVCGAPEGPAILYHHGTPSAAVPLAAWSRDALERGARLVCYERPGYAQSDPHPGRRVADAAADSAAVMDALGVGSFVTWGISGGGPHALACAAQLGERVTAAASLAGVAPFDAPGLNYLAGMGQDNHVEFGLALAGREHLEPFIARAAAEMVAATPEQLRAQIASLLSGADRRALAGELGEWWAAGLREALSGGVDGWVDDDLAFVAPFGFELQQIHCEVLVVHGEQDRFVPVSHGRWLAGEIPRARAWIEPDQGHLTLMLERVPAVHEWLLERAR